MDNSNGTMTSVDCAVIINDAHLNTRFALGREQILEVQCDRWHR